MCQCQPHTQSQRGCNWDIISESIRQVAVFEVPISYPNEISSVQFLFHKVVAVCQCRLQTQSERGRYSDIISETIRYVAVFEPSISHPYEICSVP